MLALSPSPDDPEGPSSSRNNCSMLKSAATERKLDPHALAPNKCINACNYTAFICTIVWTPHWRAISTRT